MSGCDGVIDLRIPIKFRNKKIRCFAMKRRETDGFRPNVIQWRTRPNVLGTTISPVAVMTTLITIVFKRKYNDYGYPVQGERKIRRGTRAVDRLHGVVYRKRLSDDYTRDVWSVRGRTARSSASSCPIVPTALPLRAARTAVVDPYDVVCEVVCDNGHRQVGRCVRR